MFTIFSFLHVPGLLVLCSVGVSGQTSHPRCLLTAEGLGSSLLKASGFLGKQFCTDYV